MAFIDCYLKFVTIFSKVTLHSLPAYLMDTVAYMMGKKPVMMKVVEKMHKAQKVRKQMIQ